MVGHAFNPSSLRVRGRGILGLMESVKLRVQAVTKQVPCVDCELCTQGRDTRNGLCRITAEALKHTDANAPLRKLWSYLFPETSTGGLAAAAAPSTCQAAQPRQEVSASFWRRQEEVQPG